MVMVTWTDDSSFAFINLKFIFSFVSLIYCWFIQFLLNNILQYDSIMMRLECSIILLNWSIDFILCAKPKFLPDNSCNTTCMCKDYIEFHCARLFEFWPIYNRAKSLAVMLNNINALIESQSVTCMPFDRWKSKKRRTSEKRAHQ